MVSKAVNSWKVKTEKAKARIKSKATDYVRRQVKKIYQEALFVSPQWSGNYAYNWDIETTAHPVTYSTFLKVRPWRKLKIEKTMKHAGHPVAIVMAMGKLDAALETVKWNSNVRLVNKSPVAPLIESGQVKLRPVNKIPGGAGVINYLNFKFKYLKNL